MKYQELKAKQQKEVNDFPFFFAFSNKQFEEGMRKFGLEPTDTDKIYKLGNTGGFYLKTDSAKLKEMFNRHDREMSEAMKDDSFVISAFTYEMGNHEFQLSYDKEEVLGACGLGLEDMDERLESLWKKAKQEYLDLCDKNDWY